jgi:hypothetical protein
MFENWSTRDSMLVVLVLVVAGVALAFGGDGQPDGG